MTWLIDSSSGPQILHWRSHSIPRAFWFFDTDKVPDNTCQTKCCNFGEHLSFQENAKSCFILGPQIDILGHLSGYKDSVLKPDFTEYLPDFVSIQPYVSGCCILLTAIPRMVFTLSGWKYALSRSTFQEMSIGFIWSSTIRAWCKTRDWFFGNADLGRGAGIHGSFHTEIDCPVSTFLIIHF